MIDSSEHTEPYRNDETRTCLLENEIFLFFAHACSETWRV